MNTLSKMAHEMIYRKLLYNSRHGLTNSLIQANQVSGFVPAEASATAAEMLAGLAGLENVRSQLNDVVEQIVYARQNGMSPPLHPYALCGQPRNRQDHGGPHSGQNAEGGRRSAQRRLCGDSRPHLCGQYGATPPPAPRALCGTRWARCCLWTRPIHSSGRRATGATRPGRPLIPSSPAWKNYRDDLVVIFAGYPDEMDRLIESQRRPCQPDALRDSVRQLRAGRAVPHFPASGPGQFRVFLRPSAPPCRTILTPCRTSCWGPRASATPGLCATCTSAPGARPSPAAAWAAA